MQGNIAECQGQPQTTKNCLAPNVKSAEVEKPVIRRKSEYKSPESSCLSTRNNRNEHGENITFGNWQGSRVGKTSMNTAHVFTRPFIKKKSKCFFLFCPKWWIEHRTHILFIVSHAGKGQHFIIQTNWGNPMMPPASRSASHYHEPELVAQQSSSEVLMLSPSPAS